MSIASVANPSVFTATSKTDVVAVRYFFSAALSHSSLTSSDQTSLLSGSAWPPAIQSLSLKT